MEEEEGEEAEAQEEEDEAKVQVEVEEDDCDNDEQRIVVSYTASPVMTHFKHFRKKTKQKMVVVSLNKSELEVNIIIAPLFKIGSHHIYDFSVIF